jgi:hypothetical protein
VAGKCRTKFPFVRHLPYRKTPQNPDFREGIPRFLHSQVVETLQFDDPQVYENAAGYSGVFALFDDPQVVEIRPMLPTK